MGFFKVGLGVLCIEWNPLYPMTMYQLATTFK